MLYATQIHVPELPPDVLLDTFDEATPEKLCPRSLSFVQQRKGNLSTKRNQEIMKILRRMKQKLNKIAIIGPHRTTKNGKKKQVTMLRSTMFRFDQRFVGDIKRNSVAVRHVKHANYVSATIPLGGVYGALVPTLVLRK
uniref:Uncharacterized protein n=1 Tax=Pristionchus pacificus TaxID=54126 RepID=A0A2A6CW85_PRIPA|eukprot:PDM82360.1 hypothetical protein PRIPAC_36753 [Pristionchus pacificus]